MSHSQIACRPNVACDISVRKLQRTWHGRTASFVTDCNRSFEASVRYPPNYGRRQSVHRVRLKKPKRLPFLLARVSRTDPQRTYVWLGAIGEAGVSVQLALAGRGTAATGSATEEASQSGIDQRTDRSRFDRRPISRISPLCARVARPRRLGRRGPGAGARRDRAGRDERLGSRRRAPRRCRSGRTGRPRRAARASAR
jgi:hypothetical protein